MRRWQAVRGAAGACPSFAAVRCPPAPFLLVTLQRRAPSSDNRIRKMRGRTNNPWLSLVALGGSIALLIRLGALREPGALTVLLASAALIVLVILAGVVRALTLPLDEARRLRRLGLAEIDVMEGGEFEAYVRELLEHRGFRAAITGGADDRGVDLVVEREDLRCAIQVKRHHGLVSRHAVSDAVGGMRHYDCNAAMVITNSYFTSSAIALAESNDCELVDRNTLAAWIADFRGD